MFLIGASLYSYMTYTPSSLMKFLEQLYFVIFDNFNNDFLQLLVEIFKRWNHYTALSRLICPALTCSLTR